MKNMKKKVLTKPQKIIRNIILSVVLFAGAYFVVWGANRFPAPTAEMAMRKCEEANFAEKSEIVEICRNNDTGKKSLYDNNTDMLMKVEREDDNYVSIIGLTDKYIHLTVARHVGMGALRFMYRPASFMNIPRSSDGLDFVPLPYSASGQSTYNEVYNFDGYDSSQYENNFGSCMGIVFCDNDDVAYMDVQLSCISSLGYLSAEYKFTHIEKNDSGIYPIRYLIDDTVGNNLMEDDLSGVTVGGISPDRNYYYGYLENNFSMPPMVTIRGYSESGNLIIEKHFNE